MNPRHTQILVTNPQIMKNIAVQHHHKDRAETAILIISTPRLPNGCLCFCLRERLNSPPLTTIGPTNCRRRKPASFGKCANRNGHGHNYTLEVTVAGKVDPVSGFVVDLKELKEVMIARWWMCTITVI